jgi:translation initiation factor 2B subunit (eIF-2B alpha/beta/delta family)
MSTLDDLLTKTTEDSVSGSSEIYSSLLKGLDKAVTEKPSCQQWRGFADGLSKVKRSMAPLQNLAGSIKVLLNASIPVDQINGFIKGFLMGLKEKETRAPGAIAEAFTKAYRPKKVVTISYSSTVMASLLALPKGTEVLVAESLPLGEGTMTCRRLAENGMRASLFRDSMMSSVVAKADLVLVGSDGVCPEGVVNKVGTRSLALAALERGKPVIAVCSTSKLIPVLDIDPVSSTREVDGLVYHEDLFEISPLSLFASIITEEGILSGQEMENRLLRDRSKMKNTECEEC